MRKVTTCYGEFYVEGAIATSCTDDKYYYELPHADMTNDEIKDYFEILWENEHDDEEEIEITNTVKVYITVSLEMKRKDDGPITEEDVDDIISNCDYSFSHEEGEIETEICGRELH